MGYSVRNRKLGFECDVCGVFVGDIRLLKSCNRCQKVICPLHARLFLKTSDLPSQFRRYRRDDGFCYACPDCDEERQREKLEKEGEERQRQKELEEEEANKVILVHVKSSAPTALPSRCSSILQSRLHGASDSRGRNADAPCYKTQNTPKDAAGLLPEGLRGRSDALSQVRGTI